MFWHVLMFRWFDNVGSDQIEEVLENFRQLQGRIPGLLEVSSGANQSTRSQGYTHGAVLRFTDAAALQAYGNHPAHAALLEKLRLSMAQVAVLDYEAP